MRYSYPPLLAPVLNLGRSVKEWSITRILFLLGTSLLAVVLLAMTLTTYRIATHYLNRAYARNAQTRTLAQANELHRILEDARHEIQFLAKSTPKAETIRQYLSSKPQTQRDRYREIAFHGQDSDDNFVLLNTGDQIWELPVTQTSSMNLGVFAHQDRASAGSSGFVQIDQPTQVYYSSVPYHDSIQNMEFYVLRLTTQVVNAQGKIIGTLTLSVNLQELQKIMALYASSQSPLFIFPQEKERARGFFFDAGGWLLFESNNRDQPHNHLSVDALRTGLQGDIGRPGFSSAFRPSPHHEKYWTMVTAVQAGRAGQLPWGALFSTMEQPGGELFLNYAPIIFHEDSSAEPRIIGGIGTMDTSFMFKSANYEVVLALSLSMFIAIILSVGAIFYLNRRISRPLRTLSKTIEKRVLDDESVHLDIFPLPKELYHLQHTINVLLFQLQAAKNEVSIRQNILLDELHRQPVCWEELIPQQALSASPQHTEPTQTIVGDSPAVRNLRDLIQKAGQVMADVLIIGETGTGKELTAEAIHHSSSRAGGPFISINCGALDENLLLDALFGHVRGAFSEAKAERKGAFLAASGGTLHLDEIGNASPKVQQALLRALSVRRIRPLGSDQDIPFDARIVAATNVDLLGCVQNNNFREDLYYRLAVITINTPPLRQRKEDLPALLRHFLAVIATDQSGQVKELSRGALDKILHHDWPGNIRELKNCLTRSVTFAPGEILLAEDITLGEVMESGPTTEASVLPGTAPASSTPAEPEEPRHSPEPSPEPLSAPDPDSLPLDTFNPRQKKAWPKILVAGGTNRAEYEAILGEEISVRTAQYDLRDLVDKGFLRKSGRGPTLKYTVSKRLP